MDVRETIEKRRSIRRYDPDRAVSDETIATILEAARLSPSWKNGQPWRFIVVRSPDLLDSIADNLVEGNSATRAVRTCSALIVLIGVPSEGAVYENKAFWLVDCGIAGEHIHLQASELGVGTVWVSWVSGAGVRSLLGVPDDLEIVGLFPLGYPEPGHHPKARGRKPLTEIASYERMGVPFEPGRE
ncbi:MAG: nitroreductase family protein [Thermoleophilia bacterium]